LATYCRESTTYGLIVLFLTKYPYPYISIISYVLSYAYKTYLDNNDGVDVKKSSARYLRDLNNFRTGFSVRLAKHGADRFVAYWRKLSVNQREVVATVA